MILPINPPKEVTLIPAVPAVTTMASEVTVIGIMDDGSMSVTASCTVDGVVKILTLWGPDTVPTYEQIGNWTQEQANTRIIELI